VITQTESSIADLFRQITAWAEQAGWTVTPITSDEELPRAPNGGTRDALRMRRPPDERVDVQYLGRRPNGADVVEMFAWPSLVRVRLLQAAGAPGWRVVTGDGLPLHQDWNEPNLTRLLSDLVSVQ